MIRNWALVALLLTVPACAPTSVTTTQGKAAYTADQIVIRVNELQNAAIQANAGGSLPLATTRLLVQFAVSADTTLTAAPLGWQAIVLTAWQATKAQLPAGLPPAIATLVTTLDTLLQAAAGGGR